MYSYSGRLEKSLRFQSGAPGTSAHGWGWVGVGVSHCWTFTFSVCPKASALLLQQCCKNLRFFCILAKVRAWPWAQGPGPGPGTWMLDDGAPGTEVQDLDFWTNLLEVGWICTGGQNFLGPGIWGWCLWTYTTLAQGSDDEWWWWWMNGEWWWMMIDGESWWWNMNDEWWWMMMMNDDWWNNWFNLGGVGALPLCEVWLKNDNGNLALRIREQWASQKTAKKHSKQPPQNQSTFKTVSGVFEEPVCALYRQFLHVKGHVNACQGFWGACWEGGWRVAGGAWDGTHFLRED